MSNKTKKNGKQIFQESNQYFSTLHDGFPKYLRGASTIEAAHDDVQDLLHENDPVLFPSGHTGCSVSALATQICILHSPTHSHGVLMESLQSPHSPHKVLMEST